MNSKQREAALRLADAIHKSDFNHLLPYQAAAMLREMAQEPQAEPVAWVPRARRPLSGYHKLAAGEFVWEDASTDGPFPVHEPNFELVTLYAHSKRKPLTEGAMTDDDMKELRKAADCAGLSHEFAELEFEIQRLRAEVVRLTPRPRGPAHSCNIPGCAVCDYTAGL